MLTDREIYIAALASIEINGAAAARRAAEQAERLEVTGNMARSRQWNRVHAAIEEIQRLDRLDEEKLN
jgi:hypothetical protein